MKLEIILQRETNTVRFAGDLDIYNGDAVRHALTEHLAGEHGLELDCSRVETCDAAGIQLLVAARRSALAAGKAFSIHAPAPAIDQCAELLGLPPQALQPLPA
ncbi:MAG: STAS domain-containing protein [Verrucomicrobiota bacterium]